MPEAEELIDYPASRRTRDWTQKPHPVHGAARTTIRCCALIWLVFACTAKARADTFRVLADDRQAVQARIDLIQQAQHDIVMAHYAVDQGFVPTSLLAVLQEAAQRGVRVRIVIDGLMSRFPTQFFDYLKSMGIEVRSYHPLRAVHPLWLNRRIHAKVLVTDGRQMIVGSRNLQDEHFGLSDKNFVDCDAYLCGNSAAQARRYFDWLWQTEDVQPLRRLDSPTYGILSLRPFGDDPWTTAWRNAREPRDFDQLLTKALAVLVHSYEIRLHTQNDWSAGQPDDVSTAVLHDCDPTKHWQTIEQPILETIDNARHSVLIESGYPALTRATMHAILAARRRGVQVTLVTNSLSSIDNVAVYAAYQNLKGKLLSAGVHLWEFNGPETLHAKAIVIDGWIAMIGSYNFDPRSAYLNLELVVVVRDPHATADLQQVVMQHMAKSRRVTSVTEGRAMQGWFSDAGDAASPPVSAARRAKMQLHRLTMPTFRWLL